MLNDGTALAARPFDLELDLLSILVPVVRLFYLLDPERKHCFFSEVGKHT